MKTKGVISFLLVVSVIVFSWLVPSAFAHNVPRYHEQMYVAGGADVLTQQVCLGLPQHSDHEKSEAFDYGFDGQAVVAQSLAFTQTTSVVVNVGRLQSWDYTQTYSRTMGIISVVSNGDLLTINASANSALYVRYESHTCLFRFPFLYAVESTRLPVVTK